jgi:hypothetical protein
MEVFQMARVRLTVVVLLAVFAAGGVVSAAAYAVPVWLVKGKTLGSSETALATVKFGKLTIKWEDSATETKFEAECKKASGEAELKGGEPGTDKLQTLKFKECTLLKAAKGCELTVGGVTTEELPGWTTKLEVIGGKTYDAIAGVSFSLVLEGCEKASFSKTWLFRGTLKAEVKNSSGKVKAIFPTTAVEGDTLKSEGAAASLSGEGELEEKIGGTLEVGEAPPGDKHWYYCQDLGDAASLFENSLCTKDSPGHTGNWELLKLAEGVAGLLAITSQGGKQILRAEVVNVHIEIECQKVDNNGWIENPAGGGNSIGLVLVLYLACTVPKPAAGKCEIPGGSLHVYTNIELSTIGTTPVAIFKPDPAGSTTFVEISFEKCTNGGLNKKFKVEGEAVGLIENATSEVIFDGGAPNNKLKFGGEEAELEGRDLILTDGGGGVQVL